YNKGDVVSFGGASYPLYLGATYWQSLVAANTGNQPGLDLTKWTLVTGAAFAVWTWGRITGLSNEIDRALAGSASIGSLTSGGGLAAAFDGVTSQTSANSANHATTGSLTTGIREYVGKDWSGASDQKIQQATVYPTSDIGLVAASGSNFDIGQINLNLRGKA